MKINKDKQEFNWAKYQSDIFNKRIEKHGGVNKAIVDMDAEIRSLKVTVKALREFANWDAQDEQ
tara:strand:- start:452 stop:643 length:192 start_codon:yes stop_codon:yes gene_type:complete